MTVDINNFINFLNTNIIKDNKRQNTDSVLVDFKKIAIERLKELDIKDYKGRQLTNYLQKLKEIFEEYSICLKNDLEIKTNITDLIRLALIAELATCIIIVDNIIENSRHNRLTPFKTLLNNYNIYNKKMKPMHIDIDSDNSRDDDSQSEYESSTDSDTSDEESNIIINKKDKNFIHQIFNKTENLEEIIFNYFTKLSPDEKSKLKYEITQVINYKPSVKPVLFQIMELPLLIDEKKNIINIYSSLVRSSCDKKLKSWFDALMTIPFNKYTGIDITNLKPKKIKIFLDNLKATMNNVVHGHNEVKHQIVQIMAQQIRNPKSKGNMIGIWGPPGNGKSSLIKEGISKAMDRPFIFISLGGATDASFLEGHSYTYEGSIYGRIMDGLITSKCMNPIIYFDELDKISKTLKGEEITNILIHLTDPVQNTQFRDKFFHGINIDLSRATMIFSYNDPYLVNPILMDRITSIETKYLIISQKIHIAQNYLLPNIISDIGLNKNDVIINDDIIKYIINNYTIEGGVRKLKSLLYNIVREINIANLTNETINNEPIVFPFTINFDNLKVIFKNKQEITPERINENDKCGVINGMYATSNGNGGILPIQVLWMPSSTPLEIKATGNLQLVIKESTQVALTLAFNYLTKEEQDDILKQSVKGIHIHCPDGSVSKDGPSAGTAITVALYSLFTNKKIKKDIAITGEINLQGDVSAIGGLESKIEGAKKAGVKLVLYPKENEKDIILIKERNPTLLDDSIQIISIDNIAQALIHSFV